LTCRLKGGTKERPQRKAEATVLGVATALAQTMREKKRQEWLTYLRTPNRSSYKAKFERFRKHLEAKKGALPEDLTRNLHLTMNAVYELLRVQRNEAGAPHGRGDESPRLLHLAAPVRAVCQEGLCHQDRLEQPTTSAQG